MPARLRWLCRATTDREAAGIMIQYVSLTYTPDGSSRRRTVWAELGMVTGDLLTFYPVDRNGDRLDPLELIVCYRDDCTVISAVMNQARGEWEIAPVVNWAPGF